MKVHFHADMTFFTCIFNISRMSNQSGFDTASHLAKYSFRLVGQVNRSLLDSPLDHGELRIADTLWCHSPFQCHMNYISFENSTPPSSWKIFSALYIRWNKNQTYSIRNDSNSVDDDWSLINSSLANFSSLSDTISRDLYR
jgi:hypothetical protein